VTAPTDRLSPLERARERAVREIDEAAAADTRWMADAACGDVPPSVADAFRDAATLDDLDQLDGFCAGCPVRSDCLAEGLRGRASGVYGGRLLHDGREVTS
jgi:hypothetical protein